MTFDADLPHHFENPGQDRGPLPGRGRRRPEEVLTMPAQTLFDKIWQAHEVADGLLYIDLHLVHEVTSPQAFESLRLAGRTVRRPDRTLATADHNVPTDGSKVAAQIADHLSRDQVETLETTAREFGVPVYSIGSRAPGNRARDRARARRHPAGDDDRLRGLPHLHPRGVRGAGVRHRHQRGGARAGHPDAPAAQAQLDADPLLGRAGLRGDRQGPDPGHDRPDRRGGRGGPRDRVRRARRSRRSRWRAG